MGGMIVKLVDLLIEGLYGCYNYNVKFNTDVTFLYGMNGCGKTTVLNITEAIITGQLFKLFNYKFKQIVLYYGKSASIENVKALKLYLEGQDYLLNLMTKNILLKCRTLVKNYSPRIEI